jgi:hypothetical protein
LEIHDFEVFLCRGNISKEKSDKMAAKQRGANYLLGND